MWCRVLWVWFSSPHTITILECVSTITNNATAVEIRATTPAIVLDSDYETWSRATNQYTVASTIRPGDGGCGTYSTSGTPVYYCLTTPLYTNGVQTGSIKWNITGTGLTNLNRAIWASLTSPRMLPFAYMSLLNCELFCVFCALIIFVEGYYIPNPFDKAQLMMATITTTVPVNLGFNYFAVNDGGADMPTTAVISSGILRPQ